MNKHNHSIDLSSKSQPIEQSPKQSEPLVHRPLQLPFEKKNPRMLPARPETSSVYPYLDNITPSGASSESSNSTTLARPEPILPTASTTPKIRSTPPVPLAPPEARSLYYTLDEMEDRLGRRLYWLQKRLVAMEKKIEFQQRFLVFLALLWIGFVYFAFVRSPHWQGFPSPTPTEQRFDPQLQPS
jgi:hypothetical protein